MQKIVETSKESVIEELNLLHQHHIDGILDKHISVNHLEPGHTVLFMPFLPGLYLCLNLSGSKLYQDQDESSSNKLSAFSLLSSNMHTFGGSKPQHKISKELLRCQHILDLDSLDRKSQQILR
jgi:hypothetical protein